ncbi:hypothetical protein K4A83_15005 [Spirulina subsalsa FACHB-351]|uniref:Biopolymer transporter ExbD n=1 Tax=Spirulina subsalsa FACHB-351 TaxID=234711 RepID=A0ABT3L7V7_9CYAN|nr:hypothetical protein [Spirulina subsalsa]MCW6037574.1 hypothetical protein [Spirulina subsalsa FACHB-351]
MSRRSTLHRKSYEVELFPFLSVLACTIGTLILLIIVITTQTFSEDKEVRIIARTEDGQNQRKIPRYIDCRGDGIVLHPQETFIPANEINQRNRELAQLLSEVKANQEREYLIVAVRPSGIQVFNQVRDLVEAQGIDLGYEPIEENWTLRIETP